MSVFTEEEAKSLNAYQASGVFHPYTCSGGHTPQQANDGEPGHQESLVATTEGWRCPVSGCDYTQTWAHGFTKDWSWKRLWKPGEDQ